MIDENLTEDEILVERLQKRRSEMKEKIEEETGMSFEDWQNYNVFADENSPAYQDLLRSIGGMDTLEKLANYVPETLGQVSENMFRDIFLPHFLGLLPLPEGLSMEDWRKCAGALNMPVEVVDERGEVVFLVPPIIATNAITNNKIDRNKRYSTKDRIEAIGKNEAIGYSGMRDAMRETILNEVPPIDLRIREEALKQWARIIVYYGFVDSEGNIGFPEEKTEVFDDVDYEEDHGGHDHRHIEDDDEKIDLVASRLREKEDVIKNFLSFDDDDE